MRERNLGRVAAEQGAWVAGFDINPVMLKMARERNPSLDLRLGSGYKIPFKAKFEIVQASLVLNYLRDWDRVFSEVSRVLKTGGMFVFSIGNPVTEISEGIKIKGRKYRLLGRISYFSGKVLYRWAERGDGSRRVRFAHYPKTYEEVIKTAIRNGFEIVDYKDAFPLKRSEKLFPEYYRRYSKMPFFCVWKLKKMRNVGLRSA